MVFFPSGLKRERQERGLSQDSGGLGLPFPTQAPTGGGPSGDKASASQGTLRGAKRALPPPYPGGGSRVKEMGGGAGRGGEVRRAPPQPGPERASRCHFSQLAPDHPQCLAARVPRRQHGGHVDVSAAAAGHQRGRPGPGAGRGAGRGGRGGGVGEGKGAERRTLDGALP